MMHKKSDKNLCKRDKISFRNEMLLTITDERINIGITETIRNLCKEE